MQTKWGIVVLFVIAALATGGQRKRLRWLQQLTGWQKAFGIVALIVAVIIIANPEFICLGLLGDAAFFDVLVLALTLQMNDIAIRILRTAPTMCLRTLRWLNIPSPGLRYLMCAWTFFIAAASTTIHKVLTRLS